MAAVGGLVCGCNAFVGVIALDPVGNRAAVGVVIDIAVIAGLGGGILTVEEHIGLTQAAADKAGQDGAAGAAPQAEGPDQLAAGGALLHSVVEGAGGFIDPAAAAVICKGDEGIKLALGQLQIVLIDKLLIDGILCAGQIVAQQRLGCFLGNAVLLIFLQHIIGAAGAIAHSILAIIPIRLGGEALFFLQDLHQCVADAHIGSRMGHRGSGQHKTCKQHNCQQKTGNTFHHRYTPFTQ